MAVYEGREHPVSLRVANHDEAIYLDLGTPDWSVVKIEKSGWHIEASSPVRFWRPPTLRALPLPVSGGHVDDLLELWPIPSEAWDMLVIWLVSAMRATGPYPVLSLVGEQGTGKSTLGKMVRGLVDPACPDLRGVPRDERDVMLGALASHVLALDNLSGILPWASDAFCEWQPAAASLPGRSTPTATR